MPIQPNFDRDAIVLASTSRYRQALLNRLSLPFTVCAPDVDEQPLPAESAEALVLRLAEAKARSVSRDHPRSLIIGSDQTAEFDGGILGKPGTPQRAREQLASLSGKSVTFHTGVCLLNASTDTAQCEDVRCTVSLRRLEDAEIERYVATEAPLDCAGSIKSEGLGVSLLDAMEGPDPSALIGLPLIALSRMLRREGVPVP